MKIPPELWASVVFIGQMADAYSTRVLIERGGIIGERNPIIYWLLSHFGFIGLDVFKSGIGIALIIPGFLIASEALWIIASLLSWIPPGWNFLSSRR